MACLRNCAALLVLSLGCSGGGGQDGAAVDSGNSATLTGNPVGLGIDSPDKLTRIVPSDISGVGITGTTAVLGRTTAAATDFHFLAQVTNHGTRRQCFIQTKTFDYLNAAGAVVSTNGEEFVTGSVGQLKDGIMCTDSCLDAGETGYLLALPNGTATIDAVASVRITLTSSTSDWVSPPINIVPVSYDSPARDKPFTVTVANQGTIAGTVNNLSWVVFFDDAGTPAYWDFLLSGTITGSKPHDLGPGETYVLNSSGSSNVWTGNSTRMLVVVDFRVFTTAN